jgi:hypothetical protein
VTRYHLPYSAYIQNHANPQLFVFNCFPGCAFATLLYSATLLCQATQMRNILSCRMREPDDVRGMLLRCVPFMLTKNSAGFNID